MSVLLLIDRLGCNGAIKALFPFLSQLVKMDDDVTLMSLVQENTGGAEISPTVRRIGFQEWMTRETLFQAIKKRRFFKDGGGRFFFKFLALHLAVRWPSCPGWILQVLSAHRRNYDVAISFCDSFCNAYIRAFKAKKYIGWIHEDYSWALIDSRACSAQRAYLGKLSALCCVSRNSAAIMGQLLQRGKTRILTVHNYLDPQQILSYSWKPQDDVIRLLSVGRLVKVKRFDWCIRIAAYLKGKGIKFRWEIIGDGPLLPSLRQMGRQLGVEDVMVFTGRKTNPYEEMSQCTLYVQPSASEGWGLALEEALLIGCPVVCTDLSVFHEIGNVLELHDRMKFGQTPEEMGEQIMALLETPLKHADCDARMLRERLKAMFASEMQTLMAFIKQQ